MAFEDVLGHDRALAQLRAALASGRVHHAYLFTGPEGVGKERVALELATALVCGAEDPSARPCGTCAACTRAARGNHPDVVLVLPETEQVARKRISRGDLDRAPSRDLKVADVRALERRLRLPPAEARHKVAILVPADRMNPAAQNALLKTLEEPPAATTLILVTAAEGALLPTVRSRCARVVFAPLSLGLVAREVASRTGADLATARVVATLAGGSLGAALAMDPETVAARRDLVAAVRALDPGDGLALTTFADRFAPDRDAAERHLGLVALWYRDVLAVQAGADPAVLANADLAADARADAEGLGPRVLLGRLAAVDDARRALVRNVNPRLALEAMVARFP